MRTTLKRGSARSGGNGNGSGTGRAVSLTAQPPRRPLGPITVYAAPRRGALGTAVRILGWALVVVLVAAGALAGGAWLFLNQQVSAVRAHTPEGRAAEAVLDVPTPGEPTVAAVIGYDKRRGVDKDAAARSDTIMLIRPDPEKRVITMLSFPRDLLVDVPACGGHPAYRGRINEAFTNCGPAGTLEVVKDLTGIEINYFVTVNYRSFREIVDDLGGVYMDIDRRYFNDNAGLAPGATFAEIDLHAGYQKLNGGRALDFVRYRHTDSDFYRIRRQQEFVKAMKQRVSGLVAVTRLPAIVNTITDNVEVGAGGGSAVDVETLYGYAKLAYELPAGNFRQIQIDPDQLEGYAELTAPEAAIRAAVEDFVNPDVDAPEKAAAAATGEKPRAAAVPDPASVTLEVLNGNGVAGAADEAGYLLSERGYQVVNGGNADAFDYFDTTVVYDPAAEGSKAAADAVARLFGDAVVEPVDPGTSLPTSVRVIVGQTFQGTIAPGPRDSTPEQAPPEVAPDDSFAEGLRAAQAEVDFPLLVPTVREQSSVADAEEGLRVYRLEGHDAVRLVYRTGGVEFWGVQQTSWTDAPILGEPSTTRVIGGREYRLYFNGTRLHMVAFEENGAAYWVVNSLLDRLSNETMLEIAKGLEPLGS